jgi:hypothetical protein
MLSFDPFSSPLTPFLLLFFSFSSLQATDPISHTPVIVNITFPECGCHLLKSDDRPIFFLQDYPASNRETGKISVGEQVTVLRMGYGKDFRAWKVRGSAGQEGWFIEDHDSVKFNNNGKRNQ